jgi:hypothetical protein
MNGRLTEKAIKEIEEQFLLRQRACENLDVIVAEWKSDPLSVQCFDLRIVEESKQVIARLKQLDPLW